MATLTITRGLPASGKTTWAKQQGAFRVSRDDTRKWLGLVHGQNEVEVTKYHKQLVSGRLQLGVDVIVDDTNLVQRHAREWAEMAAKYGADFVVKDFTGVPLITCLMRDMEREDNVGQDVIRMLHNRYLKGRTLPLPAPEINAERLTDLPEVYTPDLTLPPAYIVDIDGTIADHQGVRDPYDTTKYLLDKPKMAVVRTVWAVEGAGNEILFTSGRGEDFREVTEAWLHYSYMTRKDRPWKLFMRPAGDTRRDDIVKRELFDKHIRDEYAVLGVFDDRDRVVKMWRQLGLTVFQVAEGDF